MNEHAPQVDVQHLADQVASNVGRVVRGKREVVDLAVLGILSEGHVLIEDVPGTGKTTLARALAASISGSFSRVQFTADLLPADINGTAVFDAKTGEFRFRPGPVFANVLLADEINRASPKTQAALLEVMAERQVTVDGHSWPVPAPFIVLATQNPQDHDGTYPLPMAQLDRFALQIAVGYPDPADELGLLAGRCAPVADLAPVVTADRLRAAIEAVHRVHASAALCQYVLDLVAATRTHLDLRVGASPRAGLTLLRLAKAAAACQGRSYVTPDDVKRLAEPVLAHRLVVSTAAQAKQVVARTVVGSLLESVPVPSDRVLLTA